MSEPVFMDNDLGGVVYVSKNELRLIFKNGVDYVIKVDTTELLNVLENRSKKSIETINYIIEPMYYDSEGALLSLITIKNTRQYEDRALVFHCDLKEALTRIKNKSYPSAM